MDKKELQKKFTKDWKTYYALDVFNKRGYQRKHCKKCGKNFWTSDKKRKVCGDSTCETYSFIGKKVGWKHDYVDTWREFANFFQSKGYSVIRRYPTIARWRDDTWFVQASIYDFQPHVVSGESEPPANPLVVAQPSLRFNDIENIGVTSRHNSNFVMIGQHRFVSGNRTDWKEQDIDLVIECLKHFKISEKSITFAEAVWMGGGNAGPCFEVFVNGMELLTTVFMQFAITSTGALKELPLKIIDFGWGLERLAWLLNGTPTSYEIAYDPVDKKFANAIGFKRDEAFMKKLSTVNANMDLTEVDEELAIKQAAKSLKMKPEALRAKLEPVRAFYSILDHSRALLFALADGAIPSNTGGGHNLRFILRRALRLGEQFGWPVDLVWLAREHAMALYGKTVSRHVTSSEGEELMEVLDTTSPASGILSGPMYPELRQALPDVEKILNYEIQKYKESKQKVEQFLNNYLKKKKSLDEKDLVQIYESQGALPEDVQLAAGKLGVKVKIPKDFYSKVASKHAKPDKKLMAKFSLPQGLPQTAQLFYQDERMREFDARVLKILDNRYVILDKTAFFPTTGGQWNDTGNFNRSSKVISVDRVGNVIVHEVENIKFREGQVVRGELDWDRRLQLMRHHTAIHIVNGLAHSQLGNHVWQAGVEKTPEKARLDLTHFQTPTKEELMEIERKANEAVLAQIPVTKKVLKRTEAEQKYGMKIYQGGTFPGATVRIVEIPGVDLEACGGTHCSNTIEVGPIKLLGSKKLQDGVIRIELVAGKKAVEHAQKEKQLLEQSSEVFSVQPEQLPKTSERFFREWKEQRKELEKHKAQQRSQQK